MGIHTTATFETEGLTLSYEIHGKGSGTVVLLHGLLLDANINRGIARTLAARGYRVVLLDLPGHGRSDKPTHATLHRFDRYARHVIALLDHLKVEQAVIGGVSLGACVSLQVAVQAPERVKALLIEMPVMEWAAPAAALLFVPLLLNVRYARALYRFTSRLWAKVPRTRNELVNSLMNTASTDPDAIAAVLHGILVGPVAPDVDQRRGITAPALIIAHDYDLIHPYTDARNLARQMPNARLVYAHSVLELRTRPERLMRQIIGFLEEAMPVKAAA